MKLTSIRARMTASFAIAIACVMLAATVGISLFVRYAAQRQADQILAENRALVEREWDDEPHQRGNLRGFVREQNEDLRQAEVTLFAVDTQNRVMQREARVNKDELPHLSRGEARAGGEKTPGTDSEP